MDHKSLIMKEDIDDRQDLAEMFLCIPDYRYSYPTESAHIASKHNKASQTDQQGLCISLTIDFNYVDQRTC